MRRANLNGSGVETLLASGGNSPWIPDVGLSAGKIYWTEIGSSKRIRRANLDGTGVQDLPISVTSPYDVKLDVAGGKMYYNDNGSLFRANLDGTGIELSCYGKRPRRG